MSATDLEARIRASLQDWAAEIDDDGADDAPTSIAPDGAAPIRLVAIDGSGEPGSVPDHAMTPPSRSRLRALVLAGAAAVLVLVVAVAVIRSPGAEVQAVDGPSPAAPEQAPGPRAVATVLPDGYGPIWRSEAGPVDPTRVIGAGANTVQRFDMDGGSLTIVIRPGLAPALAPGVDATPYEKPRREASGDRTAQFTWTDAGAMVEAISDGPDADAAEAVLDSLVLRTSDPADGYDAPASGGTAVALRAEQIWPEGTSGPATSTVAYAAAGSSRWSVSVSSFAPAGRADLDLVTSGVGSDRQVIAGQERVVVTPDRLQAASGGSWAMDDLFTDVAWFDADGALIVVSARDIGDQGLEALIAGIDRADEAAWAALPSAISMQIAGLPVGVSTTWDDVELSIVGTPPGPSAVPGQWEPSGACIRSGGAQSLCGPLLSDDRGAGSPLMTSPMGWTISSMPLQEVGQHLTTVAAPDGWWIIGAFDGTNEDVRVSAGGQEVENQWVAPLEGSGVGIAAFVPWSASQATVTLAWVSTPTGTEVPATGVPQRNVRDIVIDAPTR